VLLLYHQLQHQVQPVLEALVVGSAEQLLRVRSVRCMLTCWHADAAGVILTHCVLDMLGGKGEALFGT
jgi:hypothetical protein